MFPSLENQSSDQTGSRMTDAMSISTPGGIGDHEGECEMMRLGGLHGMPDQLLALRMKARASEKY